MLLQHSLLLCCGLPLKVNSKKNYGRRKEIGEQLSSYFACSSNRTTATGPGRYVRIIMSAVAMSRCAQEESCQHAARRQSVAVIGAGAAGLAAAKELLSEGHSVAVFEQGDRVGGVWVYTPETEDEPLGLDPCRAKQVHSSMYHSLRTNLPREIMGFLDFPFLPRLAGDGDPRRYPGHGEVLLYLQDFAEHFNLIPHIRFSSRVTYAGIEKLLSEDRTDSSQSVHGDSVQSTLDELKVDVAQNSVHSQVPEKDLEVQWRVVSEGPTGVQEEVFDAVAICNGHYFQPKVAFIPGINKWPGEQLHSHNYRVPQPFASQVVVVIGNSSSGMDISRDVAAVAHEVHWAARSWDPNIDLGRPVGPLGNIRLHPMVQSAEEDGTILFEDGQSVCAHVILFCTGYEFSFPFLDSKGIVDVDNGRVGPLYQHVFPPLLSPSLSFIGLPFKVIPFPLMQLQSKWIAMVLSRRIPLPTRREMMKVVEEFYASLEVKRLPKYRTHDVGFYQFEYDDWLVKQCGCAPLECWRKDIYMDSSKKKHSDPDGYRDKWEDQDIYEIAVKDLMNRRTSVQYASY